MTTSQNDGGLKYFLCIPFGVQTITLYDVAKIGGATQWLRSAKLAAKHGIKVSSHLYPEISAHLLSSIENAHYLEYADWTKLQFAGHISSRNNQLCIDNAWGVGLHGF
jgi:mandelate racemase